MLILGSDTQSRFFVQCAVTWINNFVVLILIFGDLMRKVQRRKRRGKGEHRQSSEQKIEKAIQKYAQEASSRGSDCENRDRNFVDYMSSVVQSFAHGADGEVAEPASSGELQRSLGSPACGGEEETKGDSSDAELPALSGHTKKRNEEENPN